ETAEPGIWTAPPVRPANKWFANGFGVVNLIANVGGAVFRRQALSDEVWNEAQSYRTIGDWYFYVQIAGGGQIAYEPRSVAYFRQHSANSSVAASMTPSYYDEYQRFMQFLRETWDVPDATVEAFSERVAAEYQKRGLNLQLGRLSSHFDRERLLA